MILLGFDTLAKLTPDEQRLLVRQIVEAVGICTVQSIPSLDQANDLALTCLPYESEDQVTFTRTWTRPTCFDMDLFTADYYAMSEAA